MSLGWLTLGPTTFLRKKLNTYRVRHDNGSSVVVESVSHRVGTGYAGASRMVISISSSFLTAFNRASAPSAIRLVHILTIYPLCRKRPVESLLLAWTNEETTLPRVMEIAQSGLIEPRRRKRLPSLRRHDDDDDSESNRGVPAA
ncbi:hypothetical protein HZH68_001472 [Vespula germanica]|uniref:Uncharacterized protein n=1 Tax=Vespula germanica TaxID=30212 RepID=A0A834U6R0_VESGE|nr:hypothetical protein HZH68_001472 [Vespula germanica]